MRTADLEAVLLLDHSASRQPWALSHFEAFIEAKEKTPADKTRLPEANRWIRRGWVEGNGEDLIGFICASVLDDVAEIENLAVQEDRRRAGIGRRLLEIAVEFSRSAGAATIHLEVRAGNQAARSLYESMGFRATGRRSRYYADNGEDAVLYDLSLLT